DGIELTQAVQHYRSGQHLNDSADFGPDNSLPIIAGKAAWARVYVRSDRDPACDNGHWSGVTGTLLIEQLVGPTVVASTILNPVPAGAAVVAQASPVYKDQRGSISRTLNFQIPAQLITGSVRFTAKIAAPPGTYASPALPATISVDALLNRRLRIAFIPVGYNGPAEVGAATTITRAAPTLANLLISLADSLAMYPVTAAPDIRALPPHTRTEVLMDVPPAAGGCRTNVGDLKGDVDAIVAADGTRNDAVYVALYANGIPSLSGFGGCGGGNTMVTETGFGIVFAHELGHA